MRRNVESSILKEIGINKSMHIMIWFSNASNKINNESSELLPFWKDKRYKSNWKNIYEESGMIPTQIEGILILNGYDSRSSKVLDIEGLKFNMVLFMYLPKMWDNDFDYLCTLNETNHYYQRSPYEGKKNKKDPKRGNYKSISHGYIAHEGEKSKRNMVMYHDGDISRIIQMSFRGLGDSIVSSIWQ
jgi:hypothetical protein